MPADLGKQRVEHELFLRAFLSTKPPDRVATQLSRVTRDTHLVAGDVLFEAGEAPERLHFVASGRIRLDAPETAPWSVAAGSLLGVLDASIPRPRARTATAIEPTHVLTLDFVDYLDILEDNFGFAVRDLALRGAQSVRAVPAGGLFDRVPSGARAVGCGQRHGDRRRPASFSLAESKSVPGCAGTSPGAAGAFGRRSGLLRGRILVKSW